MYYEIIFHYTNDFERHWWSRKHNYENEQQGSTSREVN